MNILVAYYSRYSYPLRASAADHLYSFRRWATDRCFYLNVAVFGAPRWLQWVPFDLVVFHTSLLGQRWGRQGFVNLMKRTQRLKRLGGVKVAIPQDEFLNTDLLCRFINDFGVAHVFSAAQESEWAKIYADVDRSRVRFATVLTGYLDDGTLARIERLAQEAPRERPVTIGYRVKRPKAWLGRHGLLKSQLAEVFQERAARRGLATDISTSDGDVFRGERWYEFLLRCKYTIGAEGGASLLDRDGTVSVRTEAYAAQHPEATFEEIEAACFPGLDGSLRLFALSPRHLEACATRTCQVLAEGEYNGILVAGRHYLELKRDLSNLDQVLDLIEEDRLRATLTENAYQDIVASGRYSYRSFVQTVIDETFGAAEKPAEGPASAGVRLLWAWARLADALAWRVVAVHVCVLEPLLRLARNVLVRLLSERRYRAVRRWMQRATGGSA